MKNTSITLKKNSGSQGGMKMKATPKRGPEKLHSTQTAFPPLTQKSKVDLQACSIPEYYFQTDYARSELTAFTVDAVV